MHFIMQVKQMRMPKFWKGRKKAYYIGIDDIISGDVKHFYLRRDGAVSTCMGKDGITTTFQYFYTEKMANQFLKIAENGYLDGSCGAPYVVNRFRSYVLFGKTRAKFEVRIEITKGTLSPEYRFASNKKRYRDIFVYIYEKFYKMGQQGKLILG